MRHFQLIQNSRHHEVDQVHGRSHSVVPAGHGWQQHRARLHHFSHVFELDEGEWCFARNQNQASMFLKVNVRRTLNQVAARGRRHATHRAPGAGTNHHAAGEERTAGDRCHEVPVMMIGDRTEPFGPFIMGVRIEGVREIQVGGIEIVHVEADAEFLAEDEASGGANRQVHVAPKLPQDIEQSMGIDGTAGTR